MKKRMLIIVISLVAAFILMSGGYGLWNKPLIITGNIVVKPEPEEKKEEMNEILTPIKEPAIQPNLEPIPDINNNPDENKINPIVEEPISPDISEIEEVILEETDTEIDNQTDIIIKDVDQYSDNQDSFNKDSLPIIEEVQPSSNAGKGDKPDDNNIMDTKVEIEEVGENQ